MRVLVRKWGNSASVRIPAALMAAAKIELDHPVEVREERGRIIIEPIREKEYDIDELIAGITDENRHEEIDFGPGVQVKRVVNVKSDDVTVEVDVASGASNGYRDISLRRYFAPRAVAVFDKVDYIKVTPDAGMARVGGVSFPKQFQQFDAVAFNRGPDGKPQTADDVSLGVADGLRAQQFSAYEASGKGRPDDDGHVRVRHRLVVPIQNSPRENHRRLGGGRR